ncbi:MAG: Fic family protein [Candidatus Palauibacterales bacterium]|nr:Fic family protein [Candidatus Palauibacterales bacterium]MDP2583537.1 Fic family protein [Candidatus Palauibacterales bacterium]
MRGRYVDRVWQFDPTLYAPARYRRACRYRAFVPDPISGLDFRMDARLAGVVSDAENALRDLNEAAAPALAPLARLLLRTESIASSRVEGMQIDVRQLARAEAKAEAGGRASATALEILGNIDAMELAIHGAAVAERFSVDRILEIHARLMEHAPHSHIAGRLRTTQNWIGGNDYNPCGADYVPPPPEEVEPLLVDLCRAIDDEALPPLVQAALVHAQFETIHPFGDGNGRTGRALIHVVLRRRGISPDYVPPISVVLASQKDRYIEGLEQYREDELEAWLERFVVAAARSARLAGAYLEAVERLMERWREKLAAGANPRSDAAAWAVIDVLPAHPIITAPLAAAATGRAKSAVSQAVTELQDASVLLPLSKSRRNRSWEADGLLDLMASLEAGEPPTG